MKKKFKFILLGFVLVACSRNPLKNSDEAMRITGDIPRIDDCLTSESFWSSLNKHIELIKNSKKVSDIMIFGTEKISKKNYIEALEKIKEHPNDWKEYIAENFNFLEVYGGDKWGEVLTTGYYQPHILGSRTKTSVFSQAIYSDPGDIITIDFKNFNDRVSSALSSLKLKGQIIDKEFIPYFDRKNIDVDQKLKNKNLELAWVDPIDAFFIQIQGSGQVEFENGEKMRIGYANQNGHAYVPIGKKLKDIIPLNEMSMQKIKNYLKTLDKIALQEILNTNPSYVFFKKLESEAMTYLGVEVNPGRTIAADKKIFPKGSIAFLDVEEPEFDSTDSNFGENKMPKEFKSCPRFVFDQDVGGAIKGPGHIDLYFGDSKIAEMKAGVMKQKAKLYYLLPKIITNLEN